MTKAEAINEHAKQVARLAKARLMQDQDKDDYIKALEFDISNLAQAFNPRISQKAKDRLELA